MYSHNTFLLEPRDYGRPVKKSTSLHSLKSNPNPTYLVTAEAYFVCHISPNFQISLIFAFIGSPLSVLDPVIIKELPSHLLDSINNFNYFSATMKNRYCEIAKVSLQSQAIGYKKSILLFSMLLGSEVILSPALQLHLQPKTLRTG